MKNTISCIILLTVLAMLSCSEPKSAENKSEQTAPEQLEVNTTEISITSQQYDIEKMTMTSPVEHSFSTEIHSTGLLDVPPNGRAVISAHMGGYIKESPLLVGDQVKKGQLLLTIENIEFIELQQSYLEAKEQLTFLKSDYERQKELLKEKITSEKSFLKAESEFHRTLAVYSGLKEKLRLLHMDPQQIEKGFLSSVAKIYSPITGDVAEIYTKTGAYVSSSDEIMEIVNTDHMHLELKVFEKDVLRIKEGNKVRFSLPESKSKQFTGEIHLIGKSIQPDRTVQVHAHIDDIQDKGFIPGMFVQASIITDETIGMAIPENAIVEMDDMTFVLQLQSSDKGVYTFKKIQVSTGPSENGLIMISAEELPGPDTKYLIGGSRLIGNE